jgi:hypothetical protein
VTFRLSILCCLVVAAGCDGGSGARKPARFRSQVDYSYFPLTPGGLRVYEGHEEGLPLREEVRTLHATRAILGTACTALMQELYLADELVEVTTEWYAQDHNGNVWKFGEEGLEWDGERFVESEGSWVAGRDGASPWIAFPAYPRPGSWFLGWRPGGFERIEVRSVDATAVVPAGTYTRCLELVEKPDHPRDKDIILYAPGVGRVSESSSTGKVELVTSRGN